ncbi:MAG TPA: nucleotidyltransferase family protein, partial [Candidatus Limnocylindria bacterium]|nr:nucleotidyltransferase family protein [Candidatus Limnocylindria bacterium]
MSAPATSVAAIILAAGESRRFGGPKLLASLDGRPLVQHVIDAANASSCEPVVLVVGAGADELLAAVRLGRSRVVRNAAYATGQASSLQAGLTAATSADAAVVLLADMPGVRAGLIEALVARQRGSLAAAVASLWRGRPTPPTLLHRDLWPALHDLRGDVGARDVLAGRTDVVGLDVDPALGSLDDIDTPEDHARVSG